MSKKTKAASKKAAPPPKAKKAAAQPSTEVASAEATSAESTSKEKRNGVAQPKEGSLCRKVWDALDKLISEGKDTTFEAVRELAGKEMADATIRTQRQRHKTFHSKS